MLHDDVIAQVKHLANTIPLEDTIRAFLYSLSTGANEYRTALASLLYANALPLNHWRGKPDNGLTIIIIR